MLNVSWLHDSDATARSSKGESPPKIIGHRHTEHSDIPSLERLISAETYDMFGETEVGKIYETSCLSIVQYNEKHDIVSSVSLCNYPNIASVPSDDWLTWFKRLYRVEDVTEENTLFVHFLVWDHRYAGGFFQDLLTRLFEAASYCLHVILVLPPGVTPADVFEEQMIRILAKGMDNTPAAQSIYMSLRHLKNPRFKIRRIVEEDNDEIVRIIDADVSQLRELYGDYYISEMYRHPDGYREFIVSEDDGGSATGVMCLNSKADVDVLNENFELDLYNGLRKPSEDDEPSPESEKIASEIFSPIFSGTAEKFITSDDSVESVTVSEATRVGEESAPQKSTSPRDRNSRKSSVFFNDTKSEKSDKDSSTGDESKNDSQMTSLSDSPSISDYLSMYRESRLRSSVFADTMLDLPRRSTAILSKSSEVTDSEHARDIFPRSVYHGESNAFIIEIFAVPKELGNRWGKNFLEAAFECFPDLDYCIILLPCLRPVFVLLELFLRVPLRCNKEYPMALYITSRAAVLGEITSRKSEPCDRDFLEKFLLGVSNYETVLKDFDKIAEDKNSGAVSCILECEGTIIGLATLCASDPIGIITTISSEKNPEYIRRRYHIEDYISFENIRPDAYGRLLHFVLAPACAAHQRFFLREITRLTGFTVLCYRLYESALSAKTRSHPLPSCLDSMIPVNPRRRLEYEFRGYVETDEAGEGIGPRGERESFSIFMTTPRLAALPSSVIDARIVVVGASDCGVALVERLALGCKQSYANLTLISPNGVPFEKKPGTLAACMIPFRGRYCQDYRHLVPVRAWVNVIYGAVIAINRCEMHMRHMVIPDRKEKYVTVMNQGKLTYDYLVLTCGLQYQKPTFHAKTQAQKRGELEELSFPWNCLTINDDTEARASLEKIRYITRNLEDKKAIIFYGHNIDCYCALAALLEFGVRGSWITLIEPPVNPCETHDQVFFNDCEVDTEVMNGIIKTGANILLGWNLLSWSLKDTRNGKVIESVTLESKGKTKTVSCDAFFNFQEKTINANAFLAISRAGLVFDGQLVVDPECRTNDPFIFAAGTVTKYSRKFYAESWQHKYYNSVEVGERLAEIIRKVVAVHLEGTEGPPTLPKGELYLTLPVYRAPLVVSCSLPGGYHYLHVRKAGKKISRRIAIRHDFYGEVMLTGSCSSDIGYFRIRLNRYDSVETITCVNRKNFEAQQLATLYGKHEKMLNELKLRFRNSLISDFYAYFREPWATALFYDRFECLRIENRATLLSKMGLHTDSLTDDCIRALVKSEWDAISEEDRKQIERKYAGSVYQQELEASLLDFLQFSEVDLPMYCTPGKLRQLHADIEDSPLFFEL